MIELVLPSVHRNPQPKWQIDQFSHFCTDHSRMSLYFTMGRPFPLLKLPLPMRDLGPSKTWFLGPIRVHNPNGISIGSAVFAQMTVECPYALQWDVPPLKIASSHSGIWTPIHGSLGPPEPTTQTASRSVQPFLQDSLVWRTDRLCYSVGNSRSHLRTLVRTT